MCVVHTQIHVCLMSSLLLDPSPGLQRGWEGGGESDVWCAVQAGQAGGDGGPGASWILGSSGRKGSLCQRQEVNTESSNSMPLNLGFLTHIQLRSCCSRHILFLLTVIAQGRKKQTIKIAYKHRIFSKSRPKSSLIIFCNINKLTFKSARIIFISWSVEYAQCRLEPMKYSLHVSTPPNAHTHTHTQTQRLHSFNVSKLGVVYRMQREEPLHSPRLFECSNQTGRFRMTEVDDFTQDDLDEEDVMLLDTWEEVRGHQSAGL